MHQWQICADNNVYRGLCERCDVDLNAMVLRWINDPEAESKINVYRKRIESADA